jgi:hypothetical protein
MRGEQDTEAAHPGRSPELSAGWVRKRLLGVLLASVLAGCAAGCGSDKERGINKDLDMPRTAEKDKGEKDKGGPGLDTKKDKGTPPPPPEKDKGKDSK